MPALRLEAQQEVTLDTGSDTVSVQLFFRQGQSVLDLNYRGNRRSLQDFVEHMSRIPKDAVTYDESGRKRITSIQAINIFAGASPEGSSTFNLELSRKRAESIRSVLARRLPGYTDLFVVKAVGVDWQGLRRMAAADPELPGRDSVLHILDNVPEWVTVDGKVVDGRKRRLMELDGGEPWRYMERKFFGELRGAGGRIFSEIETVVLNLEPAIPLSTPLADMPPLAGVRTVRPAPVPIEIRPPFYMSVRTNMLYDAALIPNIGVEFHLDKGWTIGADWMYSWWRLERQHYYWRTYGGDLYVRKYFGKAAAEKPLTGHHLGIFGQILTYDFELGSRGQLADRWSWGASIEYGYALPVTRRLNIDFSLGVGYIGGEYKEYVPMDDHYVWQATRQRHWIGPTKIEVSLVWLIGRGNINWGKASQAERDRAALVRKAAANGKSIDMKLPKEKNKTKKQKGVKHEKK